MGTLLPFFFLLFSSPDTVFLGGNPLIYTFFCPTNMTTYSVSDTQFLKSARATNLTVSTFYLKEWRKTSDALDKQVVIDADESSLLFFSYNYLFIYFLATPKAGIESTAQQ